MHPIPRALLLTILCTFSACGDAGESSPDPQIGEALGPNHGLAELFSDDPLHHTFDFILARHGTEVHDGEVQNRGSHIDFDFYFDNALSVGLQGGEMGRIIDLGPDVLVAQQLGVDGEAFDALQLVDGRFHQKDADELFYERPDDMGTLPVKPGHLYVLRIVDLDSDLDLVVKVLVVDFTENKNVQLKWERLRTRAGPG